MAIVWGLSFFFTTVALRTLDVFEVLQLRWLLAALTFLVFIAAGKIKIDMKRPEFKYVVITAILQPCIYSPFENLGIAYTSTAESSIFIATIPCMSLIFGVLLFRRKMNALLTFSIFMTFTGVVIVTLSTSGAEAGGKVYGYLALLGAVICGGLYSHSSNKAGQTYAPTEITAVMAIMSGVLFSVINAVRGEFVCAVLHCFSSVPTVLSVIFLGVGCGSLCYIAFNYVLKIMNPAAATNISTSMTTTVGVLSGIVFAGDPYNALTFLGLAFTIAGVLLSSKSESRNAAEKYIK